MKLDAKMDIYTRDRQLVRVVEDTARGQELAWYGVIIEKYKTPSGIWGDVEFYTFKIVEA